MNIQCPNCDKTLTAENFKYHRDQVLQCGYCHVVLETASLCPSCNNHILTKAPILNRLNPFWKIKSIIDIFSGEAGEMIRECPICHYKGKRLDFKLVVKWGSKFTVAE